jgi:DNA-binding MarR family transcriptional regulator
MAYENDKIKKRLKTSEQSRKRVDWNFTPEVQDNTDREDLTSTVQRGRMVKGIDRMDFLFVHLKNIREAFGLSDGQILILLALTSLYKYKSQFVWTNDSVSHVSKASGLTRGTVSQLFGRLVARKGLIIKIKNGLYKLNDKVLFHQRQIDKSDRVEVTLVYRFDDAKPSMKSILETGIDIPLGYVEALLEQGEELKKLSLQVQERYNEQQRDNIKREEALKKIKAGKKEEDKRLAENKWL